MEMCEYLYQTVKHFHLCRKKIRQTIILTLTLPESSNLEEGGGGGFYTLFLFFSLNEHFMKGGRVGESRVECTFFL